MRYNRHVHITAATLSVLLALAGTLNHGVFEIRQGFTSTGGFFIEAISESDRYWLYGSEAAITLLPNFFMTGVVTIIISLAYITFAVTALNHPNGPAFLLGFIIMQTLFGGGIGHLVVSLPTWGFATRMRSSLPWIERGMPHKARKIAGKLWPPFLVAGSLAWLMVMQLGVFGYVPGIDDPETIMTIVFACLFSTTALISAAFICAMARDVDERRFARP